MKKMMVGMLAAVFVLAASGLPASSADDYKVIQNAVHNPGSAKGASWFKIVVTGKEGKGENVKITLPISLVEIMMNACPDKEFRVDGDCQIDLRKVWKDLKTAGPMTLVEIEEKDGETVKIWLE